MRWEESRSMNFLDKVPVHKTEERTVKGYNYRQHQAVKLYNVAEKRKVKIYELNDQPPISNLQ